MDLYSENNFNFYNLNFLINEVFDNIFTFNSSAFVILLLLSSLSLTIKNAVFLLIVPTTFPPCFSINSSNSLSLNPEKTIFYFLIMYQQLFVFLFVF